MQNQQQTGFSLSAIAIRRHIATLMLTLATIVVGVFYLTQLQVDLLPSITYPRIGVRIGAPGVSPEVAVEEITKPLEKAFSATEGVVQIYSQTREGQVSLDLFFQPGGDIEQALNDATAAFNRAQSRLPKIIEQPRVFKFDPSQLPVYEFALTSKNLRDVDLRVFADEELARELSVVPGVAGVDVAGGVKEEIRINVDLKRLQALGVGLKDVLAVLRARNQDISGGRIQGENTEPLTRTVGKFRNTWEIENLSLPINSGKSIEPLRVYLRDFAEVIDGTEEQRIFVSLNGEPAVKVSIQKQPDANTLAVVDGVKKRLQELKQSGLIPEDITLIPTLDDSRFIRNSINNVTSAGVLGTLLAAAAVLLFLGSLRQTLIIIISIPLATLAAIILMGVFGLSINVFSLGGLALGVGIVVDNSIVMLETIAESVGMTAGKDTRSPLQIKEVMQQAIKSAGNVESALIASTSTNLVSVLPFLLIGGFFALLFNELILTISFAVAASILVAVTVVPASASRLLAIPWSSGLSQFGPLWLFNRTFEMTRRGYAALLSWVLRVRLLVVALAFVILGGSSFQLASQIPQEILPRINTGQASLIAQFPAGTPLSTNLRVMEIVDEILRQQPETEYVFTTTGGFLFGSNVTPNPLRSSSTITLKPGSDIDTFIERVTKEFEKLNLAGIRLRLNPAQVRGIILTNSPVRGADIDIILQGEDAEQLRRGGRMVLQALDEQVKSVRFRPDAEERQPEIQIRPDWERLAGLGLTLADIGETIQTAIEGSVPTRLQRGDRLVDVRVQLNSESVQRASQLAQLPLFVRNNFPIRLGDVATIEEGQAPGEIQRINQRNVFIIAGNLNKGARLSAALAEVDKVIANLELPEGVTIMPSSSRQTNQQLQNSLKVLGSLAAFLVFVVMAVQYNSLIDPLVIMFTVPLALSGGIFGLYVTQTAFSATVLVGAVLLVGIVVNNAIIMVEFANQIREQEGCSCKAAILKAAPSRLRPVMMTTITTVLGMLPLALGVGEGAEFLQPLGVVVFSGLSMATFLTLFIIPCLYVILHSFSFPQQKRFKFRQSVVEKKDTEVKVLPAVKNKTK
ncbi:MAG: efflux RND transporter permease subunit [Oscillatoriaceae bacterium SKW80]|nr:efflux RND transporter permease subunit [Oscillatoriaceae bacterium SKYG93]MCX8121806.1 efflux RND transporter permease subunit [Oscillatoriaceae bacterium SKW80]MDW8454566.1 efflux RND transporter permease subunit [Oscillatoriaceae cyanobacterium SKYGB_i_bin93]HIK27380.1 efflux RND transporter permease subunit [Oscillatoriaceae cyanobacterium M7585_C2015_266]